MHTVATCPNYVSWLCCSQINHIAIAHHFTFLCCREYTMHIAMQSAQLADCSIRVHQSVFMNACCMGLPNI